MKNWWLGALALVVAVGLTPPEAQAKRLGSGGMQRSMPSRSAADAPPPRQAPNQAAPAQQATPAQQIPAAPTGTAPAQQAPAQVPAAPAQQQQGTPPPQAPSQGG